MLVSRKRNKLTRLSPALIYCALLLTGLYALPCFPEVKITVTKKFARRVTIAVPSFENKGAEGALFSMSLAERLRMDLDASGYFDSVKNKKFVEDAERDDRKSGRINFHEWATLKAEMLLKADYVVRAGTITISCGLYSVSKAQKIFSRKYHGDETAAYQLVHRIANDIIHAVTGEKGLSGSRIAFVSDASGLKQIYFMDFPEGKSRQVTSGKDISLFPHWTPDGKSIVFTSYVRGFPEVFIMNLSTRKARSLAAYPGLNAFADVSPDGQDILLTLSRAGNPELYRMNITTGRLARLTKTRWVESSPCWSPDGKRIAFVSNRSGSPQIYIMDSWGKTAPKRVTFEGNYNSDPDWSPDGTMITYASRQGGKFRIRFIKLETKDEIELPKTGINDEAPSWAPDSRHIVYSAEKGRKSSLYVVDIYEMAPRQLIGERANFVSPAWSSSPN